MKSIRSKLLIVLGVAMAGGVAFAQSSGGNVPSQTDYSQFSRFITDRNIFDPNRRPQNGSSGRRSTTPTRQTRPVRTQTVGAPQFTLVGTMSYEKGYFAFFNGNTPELRQVLPMDGKIGIYAVLEVGDGAVLLETADKKQHFALKIGDVMRLENGVWEKGIAGEFSSKSASSSTDKAADSSSSSTPETAPASSESEPNDILKKLMQQREKEL